MKCICMRDCQIRIGVEGKIHTIVKGEVIEFDAKEAPKNFKSIEKDEKTQEDYKVDFLKAGEEELMESKWTFIEASAAVEEAYGVKLKKEKGTKKSEIVAQILDARYRSVMKRKDEV